MHRRQLSTLCIDFFLVFSIISRQLYSKLPDIVSYTVLGLFIFCTIIYNIENLVFKAKFDIFYCFVFFCFTCGSLLILLFSGDPYPLISILYATTFYKTNKTQKMKNLICFTTFMFCFVLILSLLNIIDSNHEPIFDGFYFYKAEKLSFGFISANYTFLIFNLIILLYFVYKKKFSFVAKISFILLSSILFVFTRSRTGYIISLLTILFSNFIYNHLKNHSHKQTFILFSFLIISFAFGYNIGGIGEQFNGMLNGRPLMWNYYISQGLTFTGQNYVSYVFVDNYYLYVLIINGLICFIMTMIPLFFMYNKIKSKRFIVCLIFVFFYFIFESCFKIFVPFISYMIYETVFSLNDATLKNKSITKKNNLYYCWR